MGTAARPTREVGLDKDEEEAKLADSLQSLRPHIKVQI